MSDTLGNHLSTTSITGYRLIKKLDEKSNTIFYQALKLGKSSSLENKVPKQVNIEILHSPIPHSNELVRFSNHYTITKNLTIPGIVKPREFLVGEYGYALVMEDLGCISLKNYIRNQGHLTLKQVIKISVQLADILHNLSQEGVLHKNINPSSILIHPETQKIWLTDFGLASLLTQETLSVYPPNYLPGSLAYIAPEQTGRMNRSIDFRTDFYSLGISLYELLLHRLPFSSDDPIELIHHHLATIPTPPHIIDLEIPVQLSAIVMKLMAKNAEDRYQSALGLKHDLQQCLEQWDKTNGIVEFELGQKDKSDRFLIPERLYGRETEVKILLDSFDRVAQGSSELMLVEGFSGTGKTALINEVYKPITKQKGYFIRGKFDQFNRDVPFSAFMQAFSSLFKQLLAESDEQLSKWKQKILDALDNNVQLIIDVIPNLEIILGKQPLIPELSGGASQNRFNLVFSQFVQIFAQPKHPLVIFLDDLQWADSASLNLLQLLTEKSENSDLSLLILGAYRHNEVSPTHPLVLCLEEIEENKALVNTITLNSLQEEDISCLVADTLLCSQENAAPLSGLIYQKTQGNSFFTIQFLKGLYENGNISFNQEGNCWQCNLNQITKIVSTDDVLGFVLDRLQKLPKATQKVLKLASCIGNRFDLDTLEIICDRSKREIIRDLWSALQARLIVPESQVYPIYGRDELENISQNCVLEYRFFHDRVQQAAYSLIPQPEKKKTHYQIGQLLLTNTPKNQQEEKIFDIVNHFNFGLDFRLEPSQKDKLAVLNFIASRKSKDATAYISAAKYAKNCQYLLAKNSWDCNYDFTLSLHQLQVEILYLNGDLIEMEKLAQLVLERSKTILDKVKIYEIRIEALTAQKDLVGAVNSGLEILEMLGVEFPHQPSSTDVDTTFKKNKLAMANKKPLELLELPPMGNAKYERAMNIMMHIMPSAHMTKPLLFSLLTLKQIYLSLSYGNATTSSFVYTVYAILLWDMGDIISAWEFAHLGLKLSSRSPQKNLKPRIIFVAYCFSMHWKEHLSQSLQPLESAYVSSLEFGDLTYAGYCAYTCTLQAFYTGKPLNKLALKTANYSSALKEINQINTLSYSEIFRQTILNLVGNVDNQILLIGRAWDETSQLPVLENANDGQGLAFLFINKLFLAYTFGNFNEAIENAKNAKEYLYAIGSMYIVSIFYFYDSLSQIQQFKTLPKNAHVAVFKDINSSQAKIQNWAIHAPMNFQHKYDLVEAEKNRVLGNKLEALELYDRAIAGAKENQYIQEEALANELAAKFYLDWGKEKIAAVYMQEAYDCYDLWGAKAKIKHLEQNYPELLHQILQSKNHPFNPLETLSSFTSLSNSNSRIDQASSSLNNTFDLTAVLKSAQALTNTLELEELLKQLSQIILQNSGCDRIIIALKNNIGEWQINVGGDKQNLAVHADPLEINLYNPLKLINYVHNTQEIVLVDNLETDLPIVDNYLLEQQPQSLFALPLKYQETSIGVLYLHSSKTKGLFNPEKTIVLEFLCSQASIALHNAQIYADANLKSKVIESSVDGMAILENGLYTYINERHATLYGYKQEELIGQSWEKLYSTEEANRFQREVFASLESGGIWHGEATAQRKDKTTFSEDVSLFLLDNDKLICICRDISDRKASERALEISAIRDKTIFERGSVGFIEIDVSTQKFTRVNNLFCQMSGYSESELCEIKFPTLTHPDDLDNCLQLFGKLISGETDMFFAEKRFLNKEGFYFWCEISAYPIEFEDTSIKTIFGIIKDISDRKEIEQQLEFTQYGLDRAADCFYCLDHDSNIIQVNYASCQRTGYTKEELLGKTIYNLASTCPKDLTWKAHWEKLKRLKSYSFETVHQAKSGKIFPVEVVSNYLEFDGKAYSFDLVRDITERRQAEDALLQQRNRLSALLDNIPHIAWIKDEQSRFVAVNQPFAQACKTPVEEIIGKTDYDVWSADMAEKYRADDFQVLSSGERKVVEERITRPDGTKGWIETTKTPFKNANDEFIGTVGIAADLTERKQAEIALAASESKFRNLVENARDIIVSMTTDGLFTYVSPQIEQILGYSSEQLIGQSCFSFIHPDEILSFGNCLANIFQQGITVSDRIIRMPHIHGGWRWIVFNHVPVKDASGQTVSIQGIGRDVTAQEQREQALTAIVEGTAAKTGADFYRSCIRYLTEIFQVKYGFFAEFDQASPLKSQMLVLWNGNEFVEPYEMDLRGTPCLKTYKQNIYIASDSLLELFPDASNLALLNMESYASVAIRNSQGETIGNLGIMDSKRLPKDTSTIEFILQLFATRVSAEIERQETEDALRKSKSQLQAFLDNSPAVIYQKDLHGRYQIFNQTLANLFNFDRETFIGQTDFDFFPEDIAQQLRNNDQEVILSQVPSTLEEIIPHPDGSLHTYITNKFLLLDENEEAYGLGGVSTDITKLKQAELALQESQSQFQRMTENVPGMIYRYVAHTDGSDELTYVSSQVREIFEVESEKALQNSDLIWERVHPDDILRISNDIKISGETVQPFTSAYRLILPKKGLRWVQNMSRPERLENGDVFWDGIVVDISDRKLAEAKQQRQLDILETTSDFIGTVDPEGKILYLNEAWRNLLQRDKEEPCERIIIDDQHPVWALEIVLNEAFPDAAQNGMWAGETAILDGNGKEIPVSQVIIAHKSQDGAVEYFSTIIRDISKLKLAETQLQVVSERLEIAIQSAEIGIWEWDVQSDLLSWNEQMFTIYGVQPEDFKGTCQDWSKHVYPDDLDSNLITPELLGNRDSLIQEFRIIRTDGDIRYIFATASVQKDKQGQLIRAVGVNIDITERKLAERKLQQTNEKLAHATRMKDEFLANMSHELRTPLSAILGLTEGLQEEIFGKINPEQIKALYTIEQSGSHLLELIDDILDLTKIESGKVELEYSDVEINHLCQSSLDFITQQAEKKLIQLYLNIPFNLPNIRVDQRRIRQVLINLLNNAVKFTPEGGSISLEVKILPSTEKSDRNYLCFLVKDTGIGIAEKDLKKLFQPFVQIDSSLHRQYEGTGLGLFLVKRIIDLHQGKVSVSSQVEMGSCFSVKLPYSTISAKETIEAKNTPFVPNLENEPNIIPSKPLILVAEDNNTNSGIISMYLQTKGYRIQIADNGLSAIELAKIKQPNLILMDIQMPDLDGLTAIKHIRQHQTISETPIIALTAFAMEEDRKKCLAAGANMYLAKPVRLRNLFLSIQKLLTKKADKS